jgi:hypothetical protein
MRLVRAVEGGDAAQYIGVSSDDLTPARWEQGWAPASGGREPLAHGPAWKGRERAGPKRNSSTFDLFDTFQKDLT